MNENKHIIIIRQIVQAAIFLAKEGLPIRSKKNPGSFLALHKDATTDKILFDLWP